MELPQHMWLRKAIGRTEHYANQAEIVVIGSPVL
jgi:hypothetical protein